VRRVALLVAVLAGCGLTEPATTGEVHVQVQGTVTAAVDGAPITRAKVAASKMSWESGSLLDATYSDTQGHYSLSFVVTGPCLETLFTIMASCEEYQALRYVNLFADAETPYIRCTDEIQTIDFQLEPSWRSEDFLAVWGTSSSDVYVVGGGGTILHYDGNAWSEMATGNGNVMAVWGTSSSDVYVVGGRSTILHYDGTEWTEMTSGTTASLSAVWGTSSSDVYAVGFAGTIVRYDGTAWSELTSGTSVQLRAVWGSSPSDVYAVGWYDTILHYDGTGWSAMTSGTTARLLDGLSGVWGTSSSDVYAVGRHGTILHYDGTGWREQ